VISSGNTVSEVERFDQLKRMLGRYYTLAIRSVAEYAIDVEPRHTANFRAHLQTLEALAAFAVSEEEYAAIDASFRGELRSYRDFSGEHLRRMQAETSAATQAMQSFADHSAASGGELKAKMKAEIARLELLGSRGDLAEIREGIHKSALELANLWEQGARGNHLTIAQLQDELRALHQEMNQERRSIYIDASSGAWIRPKFDERVERLLREGSSFSVALVWTGLRRLESQHSKYAVEEVRKALVKRMEQALPGDAFVARWNGDMFAAVVEGESAALRQIGEEAGQKLALPFSVQEHGTALTIPVDIRVAALERAAADDEARFYPNLRDAARALAEPPVLAPVRN